MLKWTKVDGGLFEGPGTTNSVSGGTAAFYKVVLRSPHPATGSKGYYIAKDLAHAVDEVEFYEIAKKLAGQPGWELLNYTFEYKGVATMPVATANGPVPGEKQLLIMENLFDGKKKLRLLDIKIGQFTADSNWRGKSSFAAYRQGILDGKTNSTKEGYRMEGFDGPPKELATFDPSIESTLMGAVFSKKKSTRLQYQCMPARRFLSWLIDCREVAGAPGRVSNGEYGEAVLRTLVTKTGGLAKSLRQVPVPQKWLGSSIALLFDAGELPERGAALEAAASAAGVYIFDWGRSELLSTEEFHALQDAEKEDRRKFWNYYSDGVCRLFYEGLRAYYHRFCTPVWTHVLIEVLDYDAISDHDLAGQIEIPLEDTGGPKEFKLLNAKGVPVQKKGKDCNLKVTVCKRASAGAESAVPEAWLVTVHSADQIPNMDKKGPAWGVNFTGKKSDGFVVVTARCKGDVKMLTSPSERSKCCLNTNHPVWEETFEFGLCQTDNIDRLLGACELPPATPEQLTSWFPPETPEKLETLEALEEKGWTTFLRHIEQRGFGSMFKDCGPRQQSTTAVKKIVGVVQGQLVKATGLKPGSLTDRADPYAVITMPGHHMVVKTDVHENAGADPIWNTSFVFYLSSCDDSLCIQVLEWNKFEKHRPWGACTVSLKEAMASPQTQFVKSCSLDTQGAVHLVFRFVKIDNLDVAPHVNSPPGTGGGVLALTVHGATGVRKHVDKSANDSVDPYLVVNYQDSSFTTKTCYKTASPDWGQTARFILKDGGPQAMQSVVRLACHDRTSCLSVCDISVSELLGGGRSDTTEFVELERDLMPNAARSGETKGPAMGRVRISVHFESFADAEQRFWLEWFKMMDVDNSGNLQLDEFTEFMCTITQKQLSQVEAKQMFDEANKDNDGGVNIPEIIDFLVQHRVKSGQSLVDMDTFVGWLEHSAIYSKEMAKSGVTETQARRGGGLLSSLSDWECDTSFHSGLRTGDKARHILVWTRYKDLLEEEYISPTINLGMRMLYQGAVGAMLRRQASTTVLFKKMSEEMGAKYDSPASKGKIQHFVDSFNINMDEYALKVSEYENFNAFFYRTLKPGARPIARRDEPSWACQPCDCRLVVFPRIEEAQKLWIKGTNFTLSNLLGDRELAQHFEGGSISVHRLAPQDYHRFHLPTDGSTIIKRTLLGDKYWTVNPVAVNVVDVFTENKRVVSVIDTVKFGKVAYISVGAHMVASIQFTMPESATGNKGDDYGYFQFGGSTVVCVWEKGAITFDADLVERSQGSTETLVQMGQTLGVSAR